MLCFEILYVDEKDPKYIVFQVQLLIQSISSLAMKSINPEQLIDSKSHKNPALSCLKSQISVQRIFFFCQILPS